jgi:hypothetical protein
MCKHRHYRVVVPAPPAYEGASPFLRWFPWGLLTLALVVLASRWNHSTQFATLLAVLAYVHGRWLPYRFAVFEDGLALRFPFGRRTFLPKQSLTIRIEIVGAFALTGPHRRFGYPLLDRILYTPGHENTLRQVFTERGYDIR